jgi:hypothetical protein
MLTSLSSIWIYLKSDSNSIRYLWVHKNLWNQFNRNLDVGGRSIFLRRILELSLLSFPFDCDRPSNEGGMCEPAPATK